MKACTSCPEPRTWHLKCFKNNTFGQGHWTPHTHNVIISILLKASKHPVEIPPLGMGPKNPPLFFKRWNTGIPPTNRRWCKFFSEFYNLTFASTTYRVAIVADVGVTWVVPGTQQKHSLDNHSLVVGFSWMMNQNLYLVKWLEITKQPSFLKWIFPVPSIWRFPKMMLPNNHGFSY